MEADIISSDSTNKWSSAMSIHNLRLYLVVGLAIILTGCIDANQSTEPYNNLIWNRENALAGNGEVDTGPWFEWWYYKVILPDTGDAFYFVYGVVNPWDYDNTLPASRAYVGFGDFTAGEQHSENLPVSEFSAAYDRTDITIAGHHATATAITGSLVQDGHEASWDIAVTRVWDFNAMGWGMFVPEMSNIYWYPTQAAALFSGTIIHDGRRYDFENVPGYQDRNWGRSFPKWWAWITANHFQDHPDTVLAAGGGQPTLLGSINCLEGLVVGLKHGGKEYVFRPNDGDLQRITVDFGTWQILAVNTEGYTVEINAHAPCDSFMDIPFITPDNILFHDYETLTGTIEIKLYEQDGCRDRLIDTLVSDFGGIEYGSADIAFDACYENETKVLFDNFGRH